MTRNTRQETPQTVLVVDDEPSARATIVALLTPMGHRIEQAGDGTTALRMVEQVRPDLVLLDLMMPDMDGYEVCRRLRAEPERCRASA